MIAGVGTYLRETARSAKYLALEEVRDPINRFLSLAFDRPIDVFPGTVNLRGPPNRIFELNRYVREHGHFFPKSPKSLPYWIIPAQAALVEDDHLKDFLSVGILYPLAKTDNKSIELVSERELVVRWGLIEGHSKIYIEFHGESSNETTT